MKKNESLFPILSIFDSLAKVITNGVQNPFSFVNQTPLDIIDKKDHYLIKLGLAGFCKEDVKIKKTAELLVVTAEKQQESDTENESFFYKESGEEKIKRTITLPQDADSSTIKAKMKDGVLQIVVQRLKAKDEQEVEIG